MQVVWRIKVLYTHQKAKKRKVWQDGYLTLTVDETRGFLSDEQRKPLSTVYINKREISNGVDLESDKYLIQVEEEVQKDDSSNEPTRNNPSASDQVKKSTVSPNQVCSKVRSKFTVPKKVMVVQAAEQPTIQTVDTDQIDEPTSGSIWSSITNDDTSHVPSRANTPRLDTATNTTASSSIRETSQLLELLDTESCGHIDTAILTPNKESARRCGKVDDLVIDFPSFLGDGASSLEEEPSSHHGHSKLQLRFSKVQSEGIALGTLQTPRKDHLSQNDHKSLENQNSNAPNKTFQRNGCCSQNKMQISGCFDPFGIPLLGVKQCVEDLLGEVTQLIDNVPALSKSRRTMYQTSTEACEQSRYLPIELRNKALSSLSRDELSLHLDAFDNEEAPGTNSLGSVENSNKQNVSSSLDKKQSPPEVAADEVCVQCDDDDRSKPPRNESRSRPLLLEGPLVDPPTVSQCPATVEAAVSIAEDEAHPPLLRTINLSSTENGAAPCNNNKHDVEFQSKFIGLDEDCDVRIELDLFDSLYEAYDVNNREGKGFYDSEAFGHDQLEKPDFGEAKSFLDFGEGIGTSGLCVPGYGLGLCQFDASPVLSLKDQGFLDEATDGRQLGNEGASFILKTSSQDCDGDDRTSPAGLGGGPYDRDTLHVYGDLKNSGFCEKKSTSLELDSEILSGEVVQGKIESRKGSKLNDQGLSTLEGKDETYQMASFYSVTKERIDQNLVCVGTRDCFDKSVGKEADGGCGKMAGGGNEAVCDERSIQCEPRSISQEVAHCTDDASIFSPLRSSQLSNDDSGSWESTLPSSFVKTKNSDQKVPSPIDDFNFVSMDDELLLQACLEFPDIVDVKLPLQEITKHSSNQIVKNRNHSGHPQGKEYDIALASSEVTNQSMKNKLKTDQRQRSCVDTLHSNFPILMDNRTFLNVSLSDGHVDKEATCYQKYTSAISNVSPVSTGPLFNLAKFYKENPPRSVINNCAETLAHKGALLPTSGHRDRKTSKSSSKKFVDPVMAESEAIFSCNDHYSQSRSRDKKNVITKSCSSGPCAGSLSDDDKGRELRLFTASNNIALNMETNNSMIDHKSSQKKAKTSASELSGKLDSIVLAKNDSDRSAVVKIGGIFSEPAAEDNYFNFNSSPFEFFKNEDVATEGGGRFFSTFGDELKVPNLNTSTKFKTQPREERSKKQKLEMDDKTGGRQTTAGPQSTWARFINENREIRKIEANILGERITDSFEPVCSSCSQLTTGQRFISSDDSLLPFHFDPNIDWSSGTPCTSPFRPCGLSSFDENSTVPQLFPGSFSEARHLDELLDPRRRVLCHNEFASPDDAVDESASKWERFRDDDQYVPQSKKMRERWVKRVIRDERYWMQGSVYSPIRKRVFSKEKSLLQTPGISFQQHDQEEANHPYVLKDNLWDEDF